MLHIPNAWNNSVTTGIQLNGGVLSGGAITNDATAGISGHGLVTARVINNTQLFASLDESLIVQTAGNDNDWDGTTNAGELEATQANLEIRDTGAAFGFTGQVRASNGFRVFASGFALDFNPGSSLILNNGTYEATSSTDIGGTVTVGGADASTIRVANNHFLVFEPGSSTTLNRDLQLLNNNIIIESGAVFAGAGALNVPDGSHMVMKAGANANVLLNLSGALRPGNSEGIARVDVKDYQQSATGELFTEITGTALNQFDRLVVNGTAIVGGLLSLDIDGAFVPVAGQTFNILSASAGVTGTFSAVESSGMPAGLVFRINYLPNTVQAEVIAGGDFEQWISLFPSLTNPAHRLKTADPDGDGLNNLAEFAFDGDPTDPAAPSGKIAAKIAPVAAVNVLTLTFPVRQGPFPDATDPVGGELRLRGLAASGPGLLYTIQASDNLQTYPLNVTEVTGADAAAIKAGLPALNSGWTYVTCRSPGPVAGDPAEFMRIKVAEGP